MKKILCLGLSVLTLLLAATGCAGRTMTEMMDGADRSSGNYNNYGSYESRNGNVSTSRDGTVGGGTNGDYRSSVRPHSNMGVNDPMTNR